MVLYSGATIIKYINSHSIVPAVNTKHCYKPDNDFKLANTKKILNNEHTNSRLKIKMEYLNIDVINNTDIIVLNNSE